MVTLWVDNCSAQNKNWTLFTVLCQLVKDTTAYVWVYILLVDCGLL